MHTNNHNYATQSDDRAPGDLGFGQQFIPEAEYNQLVARAYQLGVNRLIIPTRQFPDAFPTEALPGPETVPATVTV